MTADDDLGPEPELDAGAFSTWLSAIEAALRGEQSSDVPCGTCTACCTSSQFVHVGPDETDALAHIPGALLFPAPGLPGGHVLMGYDEHGSCPMLSDGACSIYAHRPRTCRTYDCRVFAAAGVAPDDDKPSIARRVRRWRFDFPTDRDRDLHAAVRAAATFLHDHRDELAAGLAPSNATRLAVRAVEVHDIFLEPDHNGRARVVTPSVRAVDVEITARDEIGADPMRWPDGFMWGTGASSTQCEGAAPASDWLDWEQAGRAPESRDGNGFATRYADDFRLLAELGLTHHRLSIEWARIETEPGVRDERAVSHYRDVLTAAHDAGVVPWVCLHHFTLPRWFAASGGFLEPRNRTEAWARHVDFVADTFGDLVGGWQPVNETNIYGLLGYRGGGFAPGHNDRDEFAAVSEAIQLATAEAAVRLKQTGAPVASVFSLSTVEAHDDDPATARLVDRIYDVNWTTGLRLFREGVLEVQGRAPIERPDLAGAFDLIGFSFYSTIGVEGGRMVPHPPGAPTSPLGYGIWADGLGLVLDRLHDEVPSTPLLVAEYGIGTDDDAERAAYIERGLQITHDAIARGVDVRGFFHWTAVDNYEWLHGFDVSFGIVDRDRHVRPSAAVLQREAAG